MRSVTTTLSYEIMKSNDPINTTNRKFTFILETLNAVLIIATAIFSVAAINKMNLK